MTDPIDFNARLRAELQAQLDRELRVLTRAEEIESMLATSIVELRAFAQISPESDEGRSALATADRLASRKTACVLAAATRKEITKLQAALDRLARR